MHCRGLQEQQLPFQLVPRVLCLGYCRSREDRPANGVCFDSGPWLSFSCLLIAAWISSPPHFCTRCSLKIAVISCAFSCQAQSCQGRQMRGTSLWYELSCHPEEQLCAWQCALAWGCHTTGIWGCCLCRQENRVPGVGCNALQKITSKHSSVSFAARSQLSLAKSPLFWC